MGPISQLMVTNWEERQTKKIKLPTKGITVETWNVRTLYATGKLGELCHEMSRYSWNVLGISEVRWLNFGEATTDEGHKICVMDDDVIW